MMRVSLTPVVPIKLVEGIQIVMINPGSRLVNVVVVRLVSSIKYAIVKKDALKSESIFYGSSF